jgi:O-antigen ligase
VRRAAWALLLLAAFAIPWEYSLDFGAPFGNIARLAVFAVVLALIPAILHAGRFRTPGPLQALVLALFLWFCCSCFWTIDRAETLHHLRGYLQEFIIVWLLWELVDSPRRLRDLLRAYVAGTGVLAVLTIGNFVFSSSADQIRFVAEGQDPNDVARFLDLAFPFAALLFGSEPRWQARLMAGAYIPLGILAVLLTASRSGFLAALISIAGSAVLLFWNHRRGFILGLYALPAVLAALWITIPRQTLERLGTIPAELTRGNLNQRWDIWAAGWQAFIHAPLCGSGAGSFVAAAGVAPIDTAHNTALGLLVEGGVVALLIATAIAAHSALSLFEIDGALRIALGSALLAWFVSSFVATVHENRATWLLLGAVAVAARLAAEAPEECLGAFPMRFQASPVAFAQPVTREKA